MRRELAPTTGQDTSLSAPKLPVDPNSREAIEARILKRAQEVQDKVSRLEKSQLVTEKVLNLEFTF